MPLSLSCPRLHKDCQTESESARPVMIDVQTLNTERDRIIGAEPSRTVADRLIIETLLPESQDV